MEREVQFVGFSKFRELMTIWDEAIATEQLQKKIQSFLDSSGMVMFFVFNDSKYGKSIYGTGEESRLVFARMKHPNEDDPKDWQDQASFTAINLSKVLEEKPVQSVFNKKDFKKMKMVNADKTVELLMKVAKKEGIKDFTGNGIPNNFIRTSED